MDDEPEHLELDEAPRSGTSVDDFLRVKEVEDEHKHSRAGRHFAYGFVAMFLLLVVAYAISCFRLPPTEANKALFSLLTMASVGTTTAAISGFFFNQKKA